ncbi:two component transcriptional regulator, LytTR family [Lachnospiraceae bacterium C7]|nr:two component transcriptional regulator, LytTR family [Lachnospiraceae bacterium C7]
MRLAILDDDINSIKAARGAILRYPQVEFLDYFTKPEDLFENLYKYDGIFLDIELGQDNGFEIAQKIIDTDSQMQLVFLTGHASYAIDGYDFNPVNFLTKPINEKKLKRTIEQLEEKIDDIEEDAQIMFRMKKGYEIINVKDIDYIERRNRKNYLMYKGKEERISNYSMKELLDMLEKYGFFMCHQSFIVSLKKIENIIDEGNQRYILKLEDCKELIPVSRNKKDELEKKLEKMYRNKI